MDKWSAKSLKITSVKRATKCDEFEVSFSLEKEAVSTGPILEIYFYCQVEQFRNFQFNANTLQGTFYCKKHPFEIDSTYPYSKAAFDFLERNVKNVQARLSFPDENLGESR